MRAIAAALLARVRAANLYARACRRIERALGFAWCEECDERLAESREGVCKACRDWSAAFESGVRSEQARAAYVAEQAA